VIDGPFRDIKAKYYDVNYLPHCLSRGFRDDYGNLGVIGNGETIRPQAIEEVLSPGSCEDFVDALESKVRGTIPFGVGGDFETFTAPNGNFHCISLVDRTLKEADPSFYLHHTQLDRPW
jgi:tyrosinase